MSQKAPEVQAAIDQFYAAGEYVADRCNKWQWAWDEAERSGETAGEMAVKTNDLTMGLMSFYQAIERLADLGET
jgi:hypothetical protein